MQRGNTRAANRNGWSRADLYHRRDFGRLPDRSGNRRDDRDGGGDNSGYCCRDWRCHQRSD